MKKRTDRSSRGHLDTSEFDREFVADTFKTPDATAKARWQKAKRKPGRPQQGRGAKVIAVSVEKGLLERSDKLARKMGITRAGLVARGLRAVLVAEGADVA
jgi:hypothetical protein